LECEYATLAEDDCACIDVKIAEGLYNAGYRKSSEVAREIFKEIDTLIVRRMIPDIAWIDDRLITDIAKLKKKYTEEGNGIPKVRGEK
jgi:hypothetical protein